MHDRVSVKHERVSSKYSSASMRIIVVANRLVEGQVRTIRGRLEQVLEIEINITDSIVPWVVRHTSWLLNRYSVKLDGYAPYRHQRKATRREVVELGCWKCQA